MMFETFGAFALGAVFGMLGPRALSFLRGWSCARGDGGEADAFMEAFNRDWEK